MPRLSVPLTSGQHRAIRIKSAEVDLPQAEVARRFLLAWLRGEVELPEEDKEHIAKWEGKS